MTEEEEDSEAIKTELREAFRLYDKEGLDKLNERKRFTYYSHRVVIQFWVLKINDTFLGNGYITTEVLREILSELDNNMSDEELDQMIDEIDADGSGTVDFDGKSSF